MTVNRANGTTVIMCSATQHATLNECTERTGPARTTCTTTYEYVCPVGVNSTQWTAGTPSQKTGFQIVATLTGTAGECTTGQLLQMTITENGMTAANPTINPTNSVGQPGQLVPGVTFTVDNDSTHQFPAYGSATFGGDNYRLTDAASVLIEKSGTMARWWDNTDQEKTNQAEVARWRYKFVAWVKGSSTAQSSCACGFDIDVDWPANTNPTTTYTTDANFSNNCP